MDIASVRWPDSLWTAVTPPGPDLPELVGTAEADVIVTGHVDQHHQQNADVALGDGRGQIEFLVRRLDIHGLVSCASGVRGNPP